MTVLPTTPDTARPILDPATMPRRVINKQMFSVRQAADYMDVSPATVRIWVHEGLIPYVKIGLKTIRIPTAAFAASYNNGWVDEPTEEEIRERLVALVTHLNGTEYRVESVIRLQDESDEGTSDS
jgi:hypothetical protein